MKTYLSTVGKTDAWITPKYITDALGEFDLDPCAHTEMPWHHAKKEFTVHDNGLKQEWFGRVWLNPPFNRYQIDEWFKKMADHGDGIVLCSAATETSRFKDYVFCIADSICFMDHRPYFMYPDGRKASANSGQSMCLIAYGEHNTESLINSGLGHVIKLNVI